MPKGKFIQNFYTIGKKYFLFKVYFACSSKKKSRRLFAYTVNKCQKFEVVFKV
jgi:Ni,Fe-hydrogenase I cytochrome b subunit